MDSTYMANWLDHFRCFSDEQRASLASSYKAEGDDPKDLVDAICARPDRLEKLVKETMTGTSALAALRVFVLDHNFAVSVEGFKPADLDTLYGLGLIAAVDDDHATMPGAMAAVLSNVLPGIKISMLTLMSELTNAEVTSMGARYGIARDTRLETVLALAEFFGHEDMMESILTRLPELDYLGAPLVAIELGGVCFWQEVFGFEPEPAEDGGDVVPFMRRDDRRMEQEIANTLRELGVVFRVETDTLPMLVVPEELWRSIWEMGRSWLCEWCVDAYDRVAQSAIGRPRGPAAGLSLQNAMKLVSVSAHQTTDTDIKSLAVIDSGVDWQNVWNLSLETSVIGEVKGGVEAKTVADGLLDSPRPSFVRELLRDWCMGYVGEEADAKLAAAIGLDDEWRSLALTILENDSEFVPRWMRGEGVETQSTGAGHLRDSSMEDIELIRVEFALLLDLVIGMKVLWLDLLSTLSDGYWYPLDVLVELTQLVVAWATFDRGARVLEHHEGGIYLPVQRASIVTDSHYTDAFSEWVGMLLDRLLIPLGVARLEDNLVWLDTSLLRVASPTPDKDELRRAVLAEIFGDPELTFKPPASHNGFRPVPTSNGDPDRVSLGLPLSEIRESLDGKRLSAVDGDTIVLS